jgi:hypothetical protein
MRTDVPPAGWRALGANRGGGVAFKGGPPSTSYVPREIPRQHPRPIVRVDWANAQRKFLDDLTRSRREALEDSLKIPLGYLMALGLGWCEWLQAYTWPMFDVDMRVCGFTVRHLCGRKASIKGSKHGIYAVERPRSGPVLMCEGPTDTAAMISLGFTAVGRPSCRGGEDILVDWCKGLDAVVVSDADSPGRAGARMLAMRLKGHGRRVRIIEPVGVKDARAWVQAQATRSLVDDVIRNAIAV